MIKLPFLLSNRLYTRIAIEITAVIHIAIATYCNVYSVDLFLPPDFLEKEKSLSLNSLTIALGALWHFAYFSTIKIHVYSAHYFNSDHILTKNVK